MFAQCGGSGVSSQVLTTSQMAALGYASLDSLNLVNCPSGKQYRFKAAEGEYVLVQDMSIALPPPHPSDVPLNPNPLCTMIPLTTVGSKASLVSIGQQTPVQSSSALFVEEHRNLLPSFITESHLFGSNSGQSAKKKKPKNSILKTNSSFVSRVVVHEKLDERVAQSKPDDMFAIVNRDRALEWIELNGPYRQEPLVRVLFTKAHPLCHDVNQLTKAMDHLDVIIGCSTGDVIWFDPIDTKYMRINKQGAINGSALRFIRWLPGSEDFFLAAHSNGCLYIYDKNREDQPLSTDIVGSEESFVLKSLFAPHGNKNDKKTNPVAGYRFSAAPLTHLAFSPDSRHLAISSEDGCVRIMDLHREKLLDVYSSYYGSSTCAAWSPDGCYVASGGQDDLITIFSFQEHRIIARCEGHASWIADIAFDPWRCDASVYRFASVGEDCRLLLWDLSFGTLHIPKPSAGQKYVGTYRISNSGVQCSHPAADTARQSAHLEDGQCVGPIYHPTISRRAIPTLSPVVSKIVDEHPCTGVHFCEHAIIVTCASGCIRTWTRPGFGHSAE